MAEVASRSRGAVLFYVVAVAGVAILADTYSETMPALTLLTAIVGLAANYLLLRALLHDAGLKREGEGGGFGAYFVVGILSGLGVLLGLVLLVIPAIVLMVRWVAADAIVVSENPGASNALSESWEATRDHFWPLLATMLIGFVPYITAVVLFGIGAEFYDVVELDGWAIQAGLVVANVLAAIYGVFSSALSVAAYWLLRGDHRSVEEVFA
jgi:hypothetical protein